MRPAIFVGLFLGLLAITLQGVQGEEEELEPVPSEDLCRPYIEKALKDLGTGSLEQTSAEVEDGDNQDVLGKETSNEQGDESTNEENEDNKPEESPEGDKDSGDDGGSVQVISPEGESEEKQKNDSDQEAESEKTDDDIIETVSDEAERKDASSGDDKSEKKDDEEFTEAKVDQDIELDAEEDFKESSEGPSEEVPEEESKDGLETVAESDEKSKEEDETVEKKDEADADSKDDDGAQATDLTAEDVTVENESEAVSTEDKAKNEESKEEIAEHQNKQENSVEEVKESKESNSVEETKNSSKGDDEIDSKETISRVSRGAGNESDFDRQKYEEEAETDDKAAEEAVTVEAESMPEEELIQEIEVPENLRPRDHINQLLKLDHDNEVKEKAIAKAADIILRDLKRLYDSAIKPLETLYKYRDLSNRHFGDPEIFSKPLVLFMGPWSGGKSSIINYLLDNEYKLTSLRTGAEPSPAYFNILMHGEEEEVLDGTQLAADWTFSGLQKFGEGMLDRLRGLRLNNKLLEKVNIVEIPGILEIRKQVQRLFPFNDACQWFIDRADIIFLVYDPSKLDVGPETEAILDQLKGREYQTRIILNKADQVKPEELMRVQGALIWNISPLMSSAEPPIMYSTSLWSMPYEAGAATRLLYAQERAFLRDLRSAIDKRVEHKIASARRFAVRVRNHAKMVDCYLTTYYNHKTFFGNKKETSNKIIENPQEYHIYEGLSTLTNISRYDLPDPDVYRDFFRLNSLYEFPLLSSTCTYFRGCPINRLDVAIAYDLPELVGKYKKSVETALHESEVNSPPS